MFQCPKIVKLRRRPFKDNPGVRHHRQRAGQYAGREAAGGGLPQPPHRYCGSQERCQAHGGLLAKDWLVFFQMQEQV